MEYDDFHLSKINDKSLHWVFKEMGIFLIITFDFHHKKKKQQKTTTAWDVVFQVEFNLICERVSERVRN